MMTRKKKYEIDKKSGGRNPVAESKPEYFDCAHVITFMCLKSRNVMIVMNLTDRLFLLVHDTIT